MNRNPVVPYILIMALGIGLIFFMSLKGLDNQEEIAANQEQSEDSGGDSANGEAGGEGGDESSSGDFDPEALAQGKCVSCHGQNYEGSVGPSLVGLNLSADEVKDVLKNGKGAMPGGLVPDENLDAMAEWVLSLQ